MAPCRPAHRLSDLAAHYALRLRLQLPVFTGPGQTCSHRTRTGQRCGAPLDAWGCHALCCPSEGGWVARHSALRDTLAALVATRTGKTLAREVVVLAVLDVAVASTGEYIDVARGRRKLRSAESSSPPSMRGAKRVPPTPTGVTASASWGKRGSVLPPCCRARATLRCLQTFCQFWVYLGQQFQ